jgi:hypothetical protein
MSPKLTILTILLVVFAVSYLVAYRRMAAGRDLEWERRWKQLSASDRRRIYRAARRGEMLEDPGEAALAAGSARSQRQLIWHPTAGPLTMLVVFSAMTLAVALDGEILLVPIGLAGVAFSVWRLKHAKGVAGNLARAEEVNRTGSPGPA